MAIDLKELLGEKYTPELEKELFADAEKEKARLKSALEGLNQDVKSKDAKLKELETASLSEQERIKQELQDALESANQSKTQYNQAMAKLAAQRVLQSFSVDEKIIEVIAGNDPSTAEEKANIFLAALQGAKLAGETAANEQHLKNNGAPIGRQSAGMTTEEFNKLPYEEWVRIATEQPDLYNQFTGG